MRGHAIAGSRLLGVNASRAVAASAVALLLCLWTCATLRADGPDLLLGMQNSTVPDSPILSSADDDGDTPAPKVAKPLPPVTEAPDSISLPLESRESGSTSNPVEQEPQKSFSRPRTSLAEALNRPGDLILRNTSLSGALYTISEQWGISIASGTVSGEVNCAFKDAPLHDILDSILLSNGYSYRQVGQSLVVSPMSELGQVNPFFKSTTIPVRFADVNEVVDSAKLLSTPQGQIHAIPSAKTLLVVDFPKQVDMIEQFVKSIDDATQHSKDPFGRGSAQPLQVGYFRTQFISADSAKKALEPIISKDGRIGVVDGEDRVLVVDFAENLEMARLVLERVDRPRPQVRIRALIYDLSLRDVEELGINWGNRDGTTSAHGRPDANGNPQNLFDVSSILKVPFETGTTGGAFTFMSLNRHFDITAVILALQNAKDSRLLADPNVVVMDNEEATLQSVSEIPFQQLTQTSAGGQIGTTAFKEAGITLRVVPKIASEGSIMMDVSPEFSTLTGFTPGDNQPIIDKRVATTRLRVQNGETFVIGGLRQRSDVGDFKGIPYLKDLKWVGKTFRARSTDIRESELVVFVCPEIIGYQDTPQPRQQRVAETTNYRLDQIPQAEGCPWPGNSCTLDGCPVDGEEIEEVVPASEISKSEAKLPKAEKPRKSPARVPQEIQPSLPTPPQVQQQPHSAVMPPANAPSPKWESDSNMELDIASFSLEAQTIEPRSEPRTVEAARKPTAQLIMPASQITAEEPKKKKTPLRLEYDARYRATEGAYHQPKHLEKTPASQKSDGEKKSVWDKILLR